VDSPEVKEGSVETNLLFHFSDLYCDHLMLSERNLGGCIGFGDSAQAGEKPKHCGCAGIDKSIDRQLIEHIFFFNL